jgi:hypothetical protein
MSLLHDVLAVASLVVLYLVSVAFRRLLERL